MKLMARNFPESVREEDAMALDPLGIEWSIGKVSICLKDLLYKLDLSRHLCQRECMAGSILFGGNREKPILSKNVSSDVLAQVIHSSA